jgi:hypothetical protein
MLRGGMSHEVALRGKRFTATIVVPCLRKSTAYDVGQNAAETSYLGGAESLWP